MKNIIFTYVQRTGNINEKERSLLELRNGEQLLEIAKHKIKNNWLPISMNPSDYGMILERTPLGRLAVQYLVKGEKHQMKIILTNGGTLLQGKILSEALFSGVDRKKDYGIKRVVNGNLEFHFFGEEQVSFKPISNLKQEN